MIKTIRKCRVCGNPHLEEIINLGEMYIQGAFKTPNNNPCYRQIPNQIVRCDVSKFYDGCGLVQTRHEIDPDILYSNYFYKSGISASMKAHLKHIADTIIEEKGEKVKILDIAANDLTFLKFFEKAEKRVGVDPNDVILESDNEGIEVINDLFPTPRLDSSLFDVITFFAVFYDIPNPVRFATHVNNSLTKGGIFAGEVMYLGSLLKNLAYDSFVAEHIETYSLAALENIFKRVGLMIYDAKLTSTNGGSLLFYGCRDGERKPSYRFLDLKKREFEMELDKSGIYSDFRNNVQKHSSQLQKTIRDLKTQGYEICLYGTSTKVNTLIQFNSLEDCFSVGIERDSRKVGGETLWGLPIVSEEEARAKVTNKTVWLIGPYHFRSEIVAREQDMLNKGGKLLFPLPEIQIVTNENLSS